MSKNLLDTSVVSSLGLGWVTQIDWVFWSGLLVGIGTIIARYLETKAKNRESDIRERELDLDKEKYAEINSSKTTKEKTNTNG